MHLHFARFVKPERAGREAPISVTPGELGSPAGAARPKLIGVVGKNDAYTITLGFNGTIAETLEAGTYTVVVHDDSQMHNYELDGPHGKSWTFAYCSVHESVMFQHFTVK